MLLEECLQFSWIVCVSCCKGSMELIKGLEIAEIQLLCLRKNLCGDSRVLATEGFQECQHPLIVWLSEAQKQSNQLNLVVGILIAQKIPDGYEFKCLTTPAHLSQYIYGDF